MILPSGFEALQPLVAIWARNSAAERDGLRCNQSKEAKQAFYDAMSPQIGPALDHLDTKQFAQFDTAETNLMLLALAYAHVAQAVEVQGPDEAKHSISRQRLPITRAPADD